MASRQQGDVVGHVDRLVAAVVVPPARVGPQFVESSPVLMVPVDAEEPEPKLGADRLDGA